MNPHHTPIPADAERTVRALLEGQLAPEARERARVHLRECEACAAFYDRVAEAEHALLGNAAVLGAAGVARVGQWLEEPVAAKPVRMPRERWVTGLAAVAVLILVAIVVGVRLPPDPFGTRGGPGDSGAGIRVFRIHQGHAEELVRGARVVAGDELGFSYSNQMNYADLAWDATDGFTHHTWQGSIKPGVIDEPVEGSVPLDLFKPGKKLQIHAVFSGGHPDAERSFEVILGGPP